MARIKAKKTGIDDRKIAVYVRKSKVTETGKSIEIQKEKCTALACIKFDVKENDIIVYEDEGKSGFYADRKEYKKMLNDIEDNKIKAVICYKIDRISRRTIDLLNLVQQMEQKGIAFISVSDNDIDTTSKTGKIMLTLLAAIAEFERDIIAERITDNMYELAKEGRWLGGRCPLGYYSQKEKLKINGKKTTINHLEPVAEEQKIVKRIYELFLLNGSITGTANAVNDEGYKTVEGKDFTNQAVRNILLNPVYAIADEDMRGYFASFDVPIWADDKDFDGVRGIMAYNKTEQIKEIDDESRALDPIYTQRTLRRDIKEWIVSVGKHKGLFTGAEWIKVQNILAEISSESSARPKEATKSLLSGIVRCVDCGNKMYVKSETGRKNPDGSVRFRYICDLKTKKKSTCENSVNISGYALDNFVIEQICKLSEGKHELYEEFSNTRNTLLLQMKDTDRELNDLRKRLGQIELDIQNQTANLRTAPESAKKAIYADIEKLDKEMTDKQAHYNEIQEESKTQEEQIADIEKAKQTIMDFPRLIKLVDYDGKLRLLRRVLECVIVKDGKVHIFLKGSNGDDFFGRNKKGCDGQHLCHPVIHSVINTPCRVSCQPRAFFGLVRCNGFDEPDGSDRDHVFVFLVVIAVLFYDMGHQTQVAFHQYVFGVFVAVRVVTQVFLFFIRGQRLWEGVAAGQVTK